MRGLQSRGGLGTSGVCVLGTAPAAFSNCVWERSPWGAVHSRGSQRSKPSTGGVGLVLW